MKMLLMENRRGLFWSSLLILVPQAAAFLMGETIYFLPLQCLAVHWFCILVTFADWRKKPQGKRAVHLLLSLMPVFSIAGGGLVLLVKSGRVDEGLVSYFFYIGFGLMFILVGNYFPKIRQNRTMGIKVKWALENEENWNATHRFGGKVWVICGFACLLGALFPFSGAGTALMVASILSAAAVPTLYSYLYYRRQLRE